MTSKQQIENLGAALLSYQRQCKELQAANSGLKAILRESSDVLSKCAQTLRLNNCNETAKYAAAQANGINAALA